MEVVLVVNFVQSATRSDQRRIIGNYPAATLSCNYSVQSAVCQRCPEASDGGVSYVPTF